MMYFEVSGVSQRGHSVSLRYEGSSAPGVLGLECQKLRWWKDRSILEQMNVLTGTRRDTEATHWWVS